MATLSPNAKQQFFSNAGIPAAGYRLYTYISGTSTPLPTYSDKAATTPNANPIVLDSRGEAVIYLLPVSYRYVLHDDQDALIWGPRDNVDASVSAIDLSSVGTGQGAQLVGFQQLGTGAVVRTAMDKLRDIVHVNDFGAVADYNPTTDTGTDNTAAFSQAYAYLVSIGGGTIKLGRGNYLGRFEVVDPYINVIGEGAWATTLWNVDNNPVVSISNALRTVTDVSFKDFAINNRNHGAWALADGIRVTGSVFSNGCDFLTFKNIYILSMRYGVSIEGRTIWNLWEDVRVAFSLSNAMNVNSTDNCGMQNFVSCRFASATGHGVLFSSAVGNAVPTFNWNFEQCDIEANKLTGVRITGTGAGIQAWKFHNCYCENNTQGIAPGGSGGSQKANVHVDTTNALGLSFDSCTFFGTNSGDPLDYGVFLNTAVMSTVAGEVENCRFGISSVKDIFWGDGVKIGKNVYSGSGVIFNRQTSVLLDDLSTPGKAFTPALKFGGASVGMTYSNQVGRYIQIGNILFFEIYLSLSAKGTSTGQATITGLPVATAASPSALIPAFSSRVDQLAAGVTNVEARALAGTTTIELAKFAAGTSTNLANTDYGNFTTMSVTGYYFTA